MRKNITNLPGGTYLMNAEAVKARLKNVAQETGQTLYKAIKETFNHRGTKLQKIVAFEEEYSADAIRLSRWKNFSKKKKIALDVNLAETLETIKSFLIPVIEAIQAEKEYDAKWSSREQKWEG